MILNVLGTNFYDFSERLWGQPRSKVSESRDPETDGSLETEMKGIHFFLISANVNTSHLKYNF